MSKSPPDDPFAKTELGLPASAAFIAPDPFAKGRTVFGAFSPEALAEAEASFLAQLQGSSPDKTILGTPSPEALATSEPFEKGFTQLGGMGPGHTQYGGAGATLPGGLPPPEAFAALPTAPTAPMAPAAPADPYPPGYTQLSHTDLGAKLGWEAAAAEAERELERAKALHGQGVLAGQAGHIAQADALLRESLDLRRRYRPPGDILIAHGCVSLGTLYFYGQRPDLAEPLYREAWSLHRQGLGDLHPETATRAVELGRVLALLGRAPEAYGLLRGAHEVFTRTLGPMHPSTSEVLGMMRLLYG